MSEALYLAILGSQQNLVTDLKVGSTSSTWARLLRITKVLSEERLLIPLRPGLMQMYSPSMYSPSAKASELLNNFFLVDTEFKLNKTTKTIAVQKPNVQNELTEKKKNILEF